MWGSNLTAGSNPALSACVEYFHLLHQDGSTSLDRKVPSQQLGDLTLTHQEVVQSVGPEAT